jgi:radical SAM protein with 4Fe4S-binding SPASM domain
MLTQDAVSASPHDGMPNDDDVFAINPMARMRNEHDYVELVKIEDKTRPRVHHVAGVILSMCNGKRSVREISRALEPLLRDIEPDKRPAEALLRTKKIIAWFAHDPQATYAQENPLLLLEVPSRAWVVPASILPKFGRLKVPVYEPKQFFPENAYPLGKYDSWIKGRAPVRLLWHVTSACSTDCRYCFLNRRPIPNDQILPKDRMLAVLRECKQEGVVQIIPEGGDVLLYPYLFDFFDAYEAGGFMPVQFATKSYMSKEVARRLAQYSTVYQVQFSIDSTIPEIADYLTRTTDYCKRTLASIENAMEAGLFVFAKPVLTPYNILTAPRLFRELYKVGVRFFRCAPYERSPHRHGDDLYNHTESYTWFEKELDKFRQECPEVSLEWQDETPEEVPPTKEEVEKEWKRNPGGCDAGRTSMLVCADGLVMPCDRLPETDEFSCGDLRHQSVREIWEGEKLNQRYVLFTREQFCGTPCEKCEEFERCLPAHGYCFRDVYLFLGRLHTTPFTCPKYEGTFVRRY